MALDPTPASLRPTRRTTIDELAVAQGVRPMSSTTEWSGDFFESDEELEAFLADLRQHGTHRWVDSMGTKKWSEIKALSKATDADRAEARAELEAEIRGAGGSRTIRQILDQQDELADTFEAFDPSEGREVPVEEYLERRRKVRDAVHLDHGPST